MEKTTFKGSVMLNPVPVVMVSSKDKEGKSNVFTVAWIGTICSKPPMLSISIRPERASYKTIEDTKEFIVNIPSSKQVYETDFCGVRSATQIDKIKEMNFTMKPGSVVNVDYINECPINIECKVTQIIKLGCHDLFLAEVVQTHIDSSLINETGKICFDQANLLSYCHGEYYPITKNPVGKFGFSVVKNKELKKTYTEKYLDKKESVKKATEKPSGKNESSKKKSSKSSIKTKQKSNNK